MKCVICSKYCFSPICKPCLEDISILPRVRIIDGINVYSFFRYDDIAMLLMSKYSIFGSRILKRLAKKASDYFFSQQPDLSIWKENDLHGVGIDDCVRSYYSHTGVILKQFCRYNIQAIYGGLIAQNPVHYAGKTLEYRQKNPKKFIYRAKSDSVIIVDDIITTGTSMKEAKRVIEKMGTRVLFGLVLCDAKNNL